MLNWNYINLNIENVEIPLYYQIDDVGFYNIKFFPTFFPNFKKFNNNYLNIEHYQNWFRINFDNVQIIIYIDEPHLINTSHCNLSKLMNKNFIYINFDKNFYYVKNKNLIKKFINVLGTIDFYKKLENNKIDRINSYKIIKNLKNSSFLNGFYHDGIYYESVYINNLNNEIYLLYDTSLFNDTFPLSELFIYDKHILKKSLINSIDKNIQFKEKYYINIYTDNIINIDDNNIRIYQHNEFYEQITNIFLFYDDNHQLAI